MIDTRELERPHQDVSDKRRPEPIITEAVEYETVHVGKPTGHPRRPPTDTLIARYVDRAMLRASTKQYEEDNTWVAEIPVLPDVSGEGASESAALATLADVLRHWIELKLGEREAIPSIDGINLNVLASE